MRFIARRTEPISARLTREGMGLRWGGELSIPFAKRTTSLPLSEGELKGVPTMRAEDALPINQKPLKYRHRYPHVLTR